jgi:hypothetical protein
MLPYCLPVRMTFFVNESAAEKRPSARCRKEYVGYQCSSDGLGPSAKAGFESFVR